MIGAKADECQKLTQGSPRLSLEFAFDADASQLGRSNSTSLALSWAFPSPPSCALAERITNGLFLFSESLPYERDHHSIEQYPTTMTTQCPASPALSPRSQSPETASKPVSAPAAQRNGDQAPPAAAGSPSIDAILRSYALPGNNDVDLLKALLHAKAKEDERLAALDLLRVEQLRAAHTLAMHQAWWMQAQMQQQSAFAAAAAAAAQGKKSPASTFTPVTPPLSGVEAPASWQQLSSRRLSPVPPYSLYPATVCASAGSCREGSVSAQAGPSSEPICKRARAASTASSSSSRSRTSSSSTTSISSVEEDDVALTGPASKKTRRNAPVVKASAVSAPAKKISHEEVMQALRAKCERNLSASKANRPRALAPRPLKPSAVTVLPSVLTAPVSPKTIPMSPVRTTATIAREIKSPSPPLRQSAVFTPADEQIAAGSLRMLIHAANASEPVAVEAN
ncbi:BQ5605_C004g03092 [Microbotryum silenes-dioicae]|uniref:BQ5605_C004g03092 protein n=1 Tax=Microbotryum silenes-dioicae TaxID=796604 RepID=A0A2X0MWT7_9BASI|nr:BQ5605_C004g03092 [Microbotryum silenes-dioicae]